MIPFCKLHGFGNDYVVIERNRIKGAWTLPDLARAICERHKGVGSDGIAVVERLDGDVADYSCEIANPDGSFAAFSGNGTRCAAAYLYYKDIWTNDTLRLKTRSGVKNFNLIERRDDEFVFDAEIGKPRFGSGDIPVITSTPREHVVNEPISLAGGQYIFSAVNVGNPVACVFMDSLDIDWRQMGREMESHQIFPDRTNVAFVNIIDRQNVDIRIWERGAGETAASGTCSSAAAVLSAFLLKTDRKLSVRSPGGTTEVEWRDDDEIILRGTAQLVFCGEW